MTVHTRVYTIGSLAAATGCNSPTIRFYEEIGLLPKANRRPSGQRVYSQSDFRRLTFIRRCRDFGFPIEQVRELVELTDAPERDCVAARDLAQARLDDVRQKLAELQALEQNLVEFRRDLHEGMRRGSRIPVRRPRRTDAAAAQGLLRLTSPRPRAEPDRAVPQCAVRLQPRSANGDLAVSTRRQCGLMPSKRRLIAIGLPWRPGVAIIFGDIDSFAS